MPYRSEIGLWRQVFNLPLAPGKLKTCRHVPETLGIALILWKDDVYQDGSRNVLSMIQA